MSTRSIPNVRLIVLLIFAIIGSTSVATAVDFKGTGTYSINRSRSDKINTRGLSFVGLVNWNDLSKFKADTVIGNLTTIGDVKVTKFNGVDIEYNRSFPLTSGKNKELKVKIQLPPTAWVGTAVTSLTDTVVLHGNMFLVDDTIPHPIELKCHLHENYKLNYAEFENNQLEREMGLRVDPLIFHTIQVFPETHKTGLPDDLKKFKNLKSLYLYAIAPDKIKAWVYEFELLEHLFISSIGAASKTVVTLKLSSDVFRMKNLKRLEIVKFRCELPEDIPKGSKLEQIHIQGTTVNVPASIVNLTALKHIHFEFGPYTAETFYTLPSNLNQLTQLEKLNVLLRDGKLPEGFGPWPNIKNIQITTMGAIAPDKEAEFREQNKHVEYIYIYVLEN